MEDSPSPPQLWWEKVLPGEKIPLAFVRIDREGSKKEKNEIPENWVRERSGRYWATVEDAARRFHAAQPLNWQGDGVMIFLTDDEGIPAPVRGFQLAKILWETVCVSLGLPARMAVNSATVEWNPETGKMFHPAIDLCGHLEEAAPANSVVVTEDVYLMLPERERLESLACLGVFQEDHAVAYVFPPAAQDRADSENFFPDEDLKLWEKLRNYSNTPEIAKLQYVGFRLTRKEPPSLDIQKVFVPIQVHRRKKGPDQLDLSQRDRPSRRLRQVRWAAEQAVSSPNSSMAFEKVFQDHRCIVVLGEPGSGKTTLLKWLAVIAASGRITFSRHLGVEERLLPLPLSVGRLAEIRHSLGRATSVVNAIARYFSERNAGEEKALASFLERCLNKGECLVLFDGLDEVKNQVRRGVQTWLETFAASFPRNRFIVSSRRVGYAGFGLSDADEVVLDPFNDNQVQKYVEEFSRAYRRWEIGQEDPGAQQTAHDLLMALRASTRLSELARNPFMLSAFALIHRAEGRLPRHRVLAYEIFSRALCETWGWARRLVVSETTRQIPYEEEAIPILGHLAVRMHAEWPAGVAPKQFIVDTLSEALHEFQGVPRKLTLSVAEGFLMRAGEEVQILLERGTDRWGFLHLTFQEFLAAVGLHAQERFESEATLHLLDSRWEEILRLGVGYMTLIQKRPQAAVRFVRRVLNYQAPGDRRWITDVLHRNNLVATLLAVEAGDALPRPLQMEIARRFASWIHFLPYLERHRIIDELRLSQFREPLAVALREMLQSRNPSVKAHAAGTLANLEDGTSIPRLQTMLSDRSAEVRQSVAYALGRLKAPSALASLLRAVGDEEPSVREAVAYALGHLGHSSAMKRLVGLLADENPQVRVSAAEGLFFSKTRDTVALPPLLQVALRDEDERARKSAAFTLCNIDPTWAATSLFDALKNENATIRRNAVAACYFLKNIPEEVILSLTRDEDQGVRAAAVERLDRVKMPAATEALFVALLDKDIQVRVAATHSLGNFSEPAVQDVLSALTRDKSTEVRVAAIHALKEARATVGWEILLGWLRDSDARVRLAAVHGLPELGGERATDLLVKALKDKDQEVRRVAALNLAFTKPGGMLSGALKSLVMAQKDSSPEVRRLVTMALSNLESPRAEGAVLGALRDPHASVRWNAIRGLGNMKTKRAVRPLLQLLRKQGPQSKEGREALEALWEISTSLPPAGGKPKVLQHRKH